MLTKVHLVQAMVFPVAMYGCESCTIKQAERRRIDAFELWCWNRLLESLGLQGNQTSISPESHWKEIFRKYFRTQMTELILFTVSVILPFPECHIDGIIQ